MLKTINEYIWRARRALLIWLADRVYGDDVFWEVDDPERQWDSVQEWADDHMAADEERKVNFFRAFNLPSRQYLIINKDDGDETVTKVRVVGADPTWSNTWFVLVALALIGLEVKALVQFVIGFF